MRLLPIFAGLSSLALLLLSGCGSSATSAPLPASPTQAAAAAGGPGSTDTSNCHVPYGNSPAQLSSALSGGGSALFSDLLELSSQCGALGGEVLNWSDAEGENRVACLIIPANATPQQPLPLLVHLHGSLSTGELDIQQTGLADAASSAQLSGDASRRGFILLAPLGRSTHHYYPYPDTYAIGWDNWYRNLDRSRDDLNLDVAAIDQFIAQVSARQIVDRKRIYLTGWSNGAAMAQLYALNTPGIAAAAVYSSPDPYRDVQDPCAQTPFVTALTPLMEVHNACDTLGICQSSQRFHQDLAAAFPNLAQNVVIIDGTQQPASACDAACASPSFIQAGTIFHTRWPEQWNEAMFTWLREHPLP